MNDPLISECLEAIKHSEDNFKDAIEDEMELSIVAMGKSY